MFPRFNFSQTLLLSHPMPNSLIFAAVTLRLSQFLLRRCRQRRRFGAMYVMLSACCSTRIDFFLLISASYRLFSTLLGVTNGRNPSGVSLPWHLSHGCRSWLDEHPGHFPASFHTGHLQPLLPKPVMPSRGGYSREHIPKGHIFTSPCVLALSKSNLILYQHHPLASMVIRPPRGSAGTRTKWKRRKFPANPRRCFLAGSQCYRPLF